MLGPRIGPVRRLNSGVLVPGLSAARRGASYYRKPITVGGSTAGAQTDYPVEVDVTHVASMRADFGDVRFRAADGESALDYWLQEKTDGTSAKFLVKVPTIPADPDDVTIYMYYGKAGLADASDGDAVFDLYDDFETALSLQADNATSAEAASNYMAENIVFDADTNKYWWIFEDRSVSPTVIRLASADDITNPTWSVEASAVISDTVSVGSPCIKQFGDTWYIYYSRGAAPDGEIYCQSSATVNSGYSDTGISNPVITAGAGGSWEDNRVLEPYVFQVGDVYYMFYMGENVADEYEKVGYATASDPKGPWTKYGSNPVLSGDTGWWDTGQDKAADPFVFEKDGTYYVGVTATDSGKVGWRIGFFTTTDFVTFTPVADNPILNHGASGSIDDVALLRGAVSLFDGVYYFPYTARSGDATTYRLALTTLNFDTVGLDYSKWKDGNWGTISSGSYVQNTTSHFMVGVDSFGQNQALRARIQFTSGSLGWVAFRAEGGTQYLEFIANYPSADAISGVQFVTDEARTGDLGDPGAYAVYEIARNGSTSGIYSVDGDAGEAVATEVTAENLPMLMQRVLSCDWILVRKYVNPEPSASVGAEEDGVTY